MIQPETNPYDPRTAPAGYQYPPPSAPAGYQYPPPPAPPRNTGAVGMILVIMVLLLLAIAASYVFVRNGDPSSSTVQVPTSASVWHSNSGMPRGKA